MDLAGSEMTKKTKSEGKTLEEANNINKSLMVLGELMIQSLAQTSNLYLTSPSPFTGYCIAQLSSQKKADKGMSSARLSLIVTMISAGVHIPYRDSKLTKLLADSLAGNGVTLMVSTEDVLKYCSLDFDEYLA